MKQKKTSRIIIFLLATSIVVLGVLYYNVRQENQNMKRNKHFSLEWTHDFEVMSSYWKKNGKLYAQSVDRNFDDNFEAFYAYNINGKLVSISYDANENGIYEKTIVQNDSGEIVGTYLDLNEDGESEEMTLLLDDGTKITFTDTDGDGRFEKLITDHEKVNLVLDSHVTSHQKLNPLIAIRFLNSYIEDTNEMKDPFEIIDWAKASPLVTENFRYKLEKLVSDARKEDPELGLGFDPIFDAQDYPDEGVRLHSMGSEPNYVIAQGKKWRDFKVAVKLVLQDGKTLVDGCGVINIPEDKRAKR